MATEHPQPFVELGAQALDGPGVLGQLFLLPPEGERPQQGDQRSGRGEEHPVRHRVFHEVGVLLKGRGQQGVAGNERHDQLGRGVELVPVLLLGQLVDVGAQLSGVGHQVDLALVLVV